MIIDYENRPEEHIEGFKGGDGTLLSRNFADADIKVMRMALQPGASIGYHKHEGSCEVIYILSGVGHFVYDGVKEAVQAGAVHYCADGHSHSMHNDGAEPLCYLAIVPTLKRG